MGYKNKISLLSWEKKIAIFMMVFGFMMMFLVPTWQTPDQRTHLKLIGEEIGNEKFAEIIVDSVNVDSDRLIGNYEEKVDYEQLRESMFATPEYSRKDLMPQKFNFLVIRHLPTTLGMLAAIIIGVPAFWVLQIGELSSLIFYVLICYCALKIMPIKKELYAMVMLIPMALQQAGGIGYDAVLIPLCFYWIAYVLHLRFQEEITIKQFCCLIIIWLVITCIKMPYCFLMLLVLILPLEKMCFRVGKIEIQGEVIKRHRILLCLFVAVLGVVALYVLRRNFWIQLVIGLLHEWKQTLYLLHETGEYFQKMLITSSVGNFGWLDTPIAYGVAILVYLIILILALVNGDKKEESKLNGWDRFVIWGTAAVLCVFTTLSMVNHTIMVVLYGTEWIDASYDIRTALYQIPYIGGVQGRYYLPFASLLFLPFPQLKQVDGRKIRLAISVFEIIMLIYVIYILLCRYWL